MRNDCPIAAILTPPPSLSRFGRMAERSSLHKSLVATVARGHRAQTAVARPPESFGPGGDAGRHTSQNADSSSNQPRSPTNRSNASPTRGAAASPSVSPELLKALEAEGAELPPLSAAPPAPADPQRPDPAAVSSDDDDAPPPVRPSACFQSVGRESAVVGASKPTPPSGIITNIRRTITERNSRTAIIRPLPHGPGAPEGRPESKAGGVGGAGTAFRAGGAVVGGAQRAPSPSPVAAASLAEAWEKTHGSDGKRSYSTKGTSAFLSQPRGRAVSRGGGGGGAGGTSGGHVPAAAEPLVTPPGGELVDGEGGEAASPRSFRDRVVARPVVVIGGGGLTFDKQLARGARRGCRGEGEKDTVMEAVGNPIESIERVHSPRGKGIRFELQTQRLPLTHSNTRIAATTGGSAVASLPASSVDAEAALRARLTVLSTARRSPTVPFNRQKGHVLRTAAETATSGLMMHCYGDVDSDAAIRRRTTSHLIPFSKQMGRPDFYPSPPADDDEDGEEGGAAAQQVSFTGVPADCELVRRRVPTAIFGTNAGHDVAPPQSAITYDSAAEAPVRRQGGWKGFNFSLTSGRKSNVATTAAPVAMYNVTYGAVDPSVKGCVGMEATLSRAARETAQSPKSVGNSIFYDPQYDFVRPRRAVGVLSYPKPRDDGAPGGSSRGGRASPR